jgi:alpha-1,3-glucosyltransferase
MLQPAYFVYLLRSFCLSPSYQVQPMRFLSLANTVIGVFLFSLGPFALMGQLPQLLSRLFPFTRGLNHAYWAPNAWALVTAADRVLLKRRSLLYFIIEVWSDSPGLVAPRVGISVAADAPGVVSTSRGLVGDTVFAVLPNIKPLHTFIITILFQTVRYGLRMVLSFHSCFPGLPRQAVVHTDIQVFCDRTHIMWLHFLHVRLACT